MTLKTYDEKDLEYVLKTIGNSFPVHNIHLEDSTLTFYEKFVDGYYNPTDVMMIKGSYMHILSYDLEGNPQMTFYDPKTSFSLDHDLLGALEYEFPIIPFPMDEKLFFGIDPVFYFDNMPPHNVSLVNPIEMFLKSGDYPGVIIPYK